MNIAAECLVDIDGRRAVVLYEVGKFSTPIALLDNHGAKLLLERLQQALKSKTYCITRAGGSQGIIETMTAE